MTDEELITALRMWSKSELDREAADRIEALVRERDQWIEHTKNAVWSDSEELRLAKARAERLEAALREIAGECGCSIARAALKGEEG